MEMIERVARALWGEWALWSPPIREAKPSWDDLAEGNKDIARRMARAALTELRIPTEAMLEAGLAQIPDGGFDYGVRECDVKDAWRAMIDVALGEKR